MALGAGGDDVMESAMMMKTALALLTLTALGGVAMAVQILGRKLAPPHWLAMLHGLLAASALTLLLYAYFTAGLPTSAAWALLLFLVAAVGGAFLNLGYHMKGIAMPKGIVVVHAGVAVAGYVMLLLAVFKLP
jgi:hypothetical protein